MNRLKMLALWAMLVASLMVFAGSASATPLTSPTSSPYTGTIKAEADGALSLHNAVGTVTCQKSSVEGKVESHSSTTAGGNVASLTFGECDQSVKVLKGGSLEVHSIGGGKATVTSSGAEITIEMFGVNCLHKTSNTHIGTLTDSNLTGGAATLDISGTIPRTGHSFFCGATGNWTGSYKVTTPSALYVD